MIDYSDDRKPALGAVIDLYRSVDWSSADKPDALHKGLLASHRSRGAASCQDAEP